MILDDTGRDAERASSDQLSPAGSEDQAASEFDPRYDASFQRGYQPHPGERARTRLRSQPRDESPYRRPGATAAAGGQDRVTRFRVAAAGVAADPGDEPAIAVGRPAAVAEPLPVADLSPVAELPPVAGSVLTPRASIFDGLDVSPRRNPYFLALWIIGCGFVVLGIVLYVVSVFSSYTASPTASQDVTTLVFSQVGWMLAGPLITVGLATVVTLIVLSALTHRRAPGSSASEPSGTEPGGTEPGGTEPDDGER